MCYLNIKHRNLFCLLFAVLVLGIATTASAICFDTGILASYEQTEVSDLNVLPNPGFSPTLDCAWPVRGGVNDVPEATQGDYILKLAWTNESDHKIEAGHYWDSSTFDLADVNYIFVDVYFATEAALPAPDKQNVSIWSNWDSSAHWISCESVPPTTGDWYTVGFYVGNLDYTDLNNIDALTFESMEGTAGTIYVDNLWAPIGIEWPHIRRKIKFSGYWWSLLQSDYPIGAGPSYFTDNPNDVWVDPNGHLHLSIVHRDCNWYCSEAIANENPGYGTYVWTVRDEVDSFDPNIIAALFIYDVPDQSGNHREIDVEFGRWGDANDPNNAQFVVQPWDHPGNVHRFRIGYTSDTETTTHEITWLPDQIDFRSYYGDPPLRNPEDIIETWSYENVNDIPAPGCENPRINFYLMGGEPPTNGEDAELVIKTFQHLHNIPAYIEIKPETLNLTRKNGPLTCNIRLPQGYDAVDIRPCCIFLEEKIKAERITFKKQKHLAKATFSGADVQEMLIERAELGDVELTLRGQLADGTRFKGHDTITILHKKGKK